MAGIVLFPSARTLGLACASSVLASPPPRKIPTIFAPQILFSVVRCFLGLDAELMMTNNAAWVPTQDAIDADIVDMTAEEETIR